MNYLLKNIDAKKSIILILSLIFLDQFVKIYIKLNYPLTAYGEPPIIDLGFFKLLFIENKGMAMGAKLNNLIPFLDDNTAKLILTIFRIFACIGIGFWLKSIIKSKGSQLLIICVCLIFAGAVGNLIDSVFYGMVFSSSYGQVASLFPESGYASLFYGSVVDMIQFPLATWNWPAWVPFIGGDEYTFFEYVFNFADSYISTGVILLLIFNKKVSL
ncbi:lipoprotein signal peptidase [Flavobacteriaceae bacterium]|nr:lipoprotein signal peptidase [Flavobacteriaceae bacterium]MDA9817407.1 lipoprotein signal peptidase [Flavobacteriaceae bacterium]MDC0559550.1 lipoprotein signal peptidase [Flavobacteriaceae bacterium]MDC0879232.1 lipoprotein signal peptidase [Flavobacteriaceae bacterium]MDC6461596.1 lipoprotein signal peptidase [Flavobacteriaceae bacterium]